MRRAQLVLPVLPALLVLSLTACGPGPQAPGVSSSPPVESVSVPVRPVPKPASISAAPDIPEEEPGLVWDPDYKLDIDFPAVSKGRLELPIQGATGYASVTLPLWEEIPPEKPIEPETPPETPETSAEPAQEPTETPAEPTPETADTPTEPTPETADTPTEPTAETPEPTSPTEPAPDSSVPAPDTPEGSGQTPSEGSEGTSSPAPDSSAVPEPEGEEPPLPAQDPTPDPAGAENPSSSAPPNGEIIYAPGEEPIPEPPEPEPDPFAGALAVLEPGTAFTILQEDGDWWLVQCRENTGWIQHRYCLINLPDVIPSMVYNATNSYDSRYISVGKPIPKITGAAFYPGASQNPRLNRREFLMPVLYSMAYRICQAQHAALAQGNTLVLYEGYRPHEVQRAVYRALSSLSQTDPQVREGTTSAPWNISWFIAGGYSNHQRGFAMDVSLARVERAKIEVIGDYKVLRVQEYQEYTMPTPIHELSKAAATFTGPVATHSPTAWRHAQLASTMNEPALALQRYCTGAGLTPLASEWWHFNDLETRAGVLDNLSVGDYKISACLSTAP